MGSKTATKRLHALFSGRVQGVGFRYDTIRIAAEFDVVGSVRNTVDGNVELIAEGPERELIAFLCAIETSRLGRYITGKSVAWAAADGTFNTFGISNS